MSKKYAVKVTKENKQELTYWVVSHKNFDDAYLPISDFVTEDPREDNSFQLWCSNISEYPNYKEVTIEEFFRNK